MRAQETKCSLIANPQEGQEPQFHLLVPCLSMGTAGQVTGPAFEGPSHTSDPQPQRLAFRSPWGPWKPLKHSSAPASACLGRGCPVVLRCGPWARVGATPGHHAAGTPCCSLTPVTFRSAPPSSRLQGEQLRCWSSSLPSSPLPPGDLWPLIQPLLPPCWGTS